MQRSTTNINYKPDRGGTAGLVCRNRPAWGWKPEKWQVVGVVLHQPLNLSIFLIFGKKRQKMNGVSVYPGQKSQNAPTWQVENTAR